MDWHPGQSPRRGRRSLRTGGVDGGGSGPRGGMACGDAKQPRKVFIVRLIPRKSLRFAQFARSVDARQRRRDVLIPIDPPFIPPYPGDETNMEEGCHDARPDLIDEQQIRTA